MSLFGSVKAKREQNIVKIILADFEKVRIYYYLNRFLFLPIKESAFMKRYFWRDFSFGSKRKIKQTKKSLE